MNYHTSAIHSHRTPDRSISTSSSSTTTAVAGPSSTTTSTPTLRKCLLAETGRLLTAYPVELQGARDWCRRVQLECGAEDTHPKPEPIHWEWKQQLNHYCVLYETTYGWVWMPIWPREMEEVLLETGQIIDVFAPDEPIGDAVSDNGGASDPGTRIPGPSKPGYVRARTAAAITAITSTTASTPTIATTSAIHIPPPSISSSTGLSSATCDNAIRSSSISTLPGISSSPVISSDSLLHKHVEGYEGVCGVESGSEVELLHDIEIDELCEGDGGLDAVDGERDRVIERRGVVPMRYDGDSGTGTEGVPLVHDAEGDNDDNADKHDDDDDNNNRRVHDTSLRKHVDDDMDGDDLRLDVDNDIYDDELRIYADGHENVYLNESMSKSSFWQMDPHPPKMIVAANGTFKGFERKDKCQNCLNQHHECLTKTRYGAIICTACVKNKRKNCSHKNTTAARIAQISVGLAAEHALLYQQIRFIGTAAKRSEKFYITPADTEALLCKQRDLAKWTDHLCIISLQFLHTSPAPTLIKAYSKCMQEDAIAAIKACGGLDSEAALAIDHGGKEFCRETTAAGDPRSAPHQAKRVPAEPTANRKKPGKTPTLDGDKTPRAAITSLGNFAPSVVVPNSFKKRKTSTTTLSQDESHKRTKSAAVDDARWRVDDPRWGGGSAPP